MRRNLLLTFGLCLMLGGILLFGYTQWATSQGQTQCAETVRLMEDSLPPRTQGLTGLFSNPDMPVRSINGTDYSALLTVPAYGVKLPVAHLWESRDLLRGPCRFSGSVYDGSLVIGGTDREGQLEFCKRLNIGDEIRITDMIGMEFRYTVTRVERTSKISAEKLMKDEYELTVYAKDSYSMEYILVRCNAAAG